MNHLAPFWSSRYIDTDIDVCIYIYTWKPNDPFFVGKGLVLKSWSPKIEDKEVPGTYIYICIYAHIYVCNSCLCLFPSTKSAGNLAHHWRSTYIHSTNWDPLSLYTPSNNLLSAHVCMCVLLYMHVWKHHYLYPYRYPRSTSIHVMYILRISESHIYGMFASLFTVNPCHTLKILYIYICIYICINV